MSCPEAPALSRAARSWGAGASHTSTGVEFRQFEARGGVRAFCGLPAPPSSPQFETEAQQDGREEGGVAPQLL